MSHGNILGLDIGGRRIGVARVNMQVKLPQPLGALINNKSFIDELKKIIAEYDIDTLVVGLPRNLNGEETAQSKSVREFCEQNLKVLDLPIILQDETLTTNEAEKRLKSEGLELANADAVAAVVILEDYIKGTDPN
jgi:putative Holliday junction resolvase